MSTATTKRISMMSVDGEGLTRIARDFCLSDMPSRGWRLLVNGLHGPVGAETIAADVLDGKMKLVGNSASKRGIRTARDNAKSHRETMHYIFAGRVRIDGSWWRPFAEVVAFGEPDAAFAFERHGHEHDFPESDILRAFDRGETLGDAGYPFLKKMAKSRAEYYADAGERVVIVRTADSEHDRAIIFEPVGERPFWWPEHTSVAAAFEEFVASGRRLRERGPVAPRDSIGTVVVGFAEAVAKARSSTEDEATRREREDEEDEEARCEEESYAARIADIRTRVLEQANGDMIELRLASGKKVPVPRAPFEQWALTRAGSRHLAAPWTPVAPSGMKLPLDDPFHTDWLIGAGAALSEAYRGELYDAAIERMGELQHRFANFNCTVLVEHGDVVGVVGKDIVVLPDLDPKHVEKLAKATAVITQAGGALAHLAQVALDRNIPVVLVTDALTRYPPGTRLRVSAEKGRVYILGKEPLP